MKYNFETFTSRRHLGSAKYESMLELKADVKEGVVPLSVADMEFNVAPEILEGLKKYLNDQILGYPFASQEYYKSVISWYERRFSFTCKKEDLIQTRGVVPSIFTAVEAFTEKGQGVILFTPVYGPFYSAVQENDRKLVKCPIEKKDKYRINFELFEKLAKDPNNKLVLVCNPHNPLGRVWEREELEKIAKIAKENDMVVFSDEIHADIIYKQNKFTSFASLTDYRDIMLVSNAPSKTFNIAGLCTSNNIVFDKELKEKFSAILNKNHTAGANILGYKACQLAYDKAEGWMEEMLDVVYDNYKYVKRYFEENIKDIEATENEGTFLMWLDFRKLNIEDEKLSELLIEEDIFLSEGSFFGEEGIGFRRLNIGCPKYVLEDFCKKMNSFVKKHGGR